MSEPHNHVSAATEDQFEVTDGDRLFAEHILADFGSFEEGITEQEKLAEWVRNIRRAASMPDAAQPARKPAYADEAFEYYAQTGSYHRITASQPSPAATVETSPPGQVRADFLAYWNEHQACPEHSLTTENAAHACWQEAYKKYAHHPHSSAATDDLIERLRNPMWAHSTAPFPSPQLEQEENLAAMNEAAAEIERLRTVPQTAGMTGALKRADEALNQMMIWMPSGFAPQSQDNAMRLAREARNEIAALALSRPEHS